ncbi:hypothetical protein LINPERPRIM_LOCUS8829 [Linum perenne]
MSGDKLWFLKLDTSFKCHVKLGNGSKLEVVGKGSIKLLIDQIPFIIQDVFYVPGLKTNLLSVGQLQEKGLAFSIKHGVCKIFHDQRGLLLQTTMKTNRMFVLHAEYKSESNENDLQCLQTNASKETNLNMVISMPRVIKVCSSRDSYKDFHR